MPQKLMKLMSAIKPTAANNWGTRQQHAEITVKRERRGSGRGDATRQHQNTDEKRNERCGEGSRGIGRRPRAVRNTGAQLRVAQSCDEGEHSGEQERNPSALSGHPRDLAHEGVDPCAQNVPDAVEDQGSETQVAGKARLLRQFLFFA